MKDPRSAGAVGIIGAGISGLTLAERLTARGIPTVVYEANSRAGGNVRTHREDGWTAEDGPNALTADAGILEWIGQLGLSGRLRPAQRTIQRRFIERSGQVHLLPTSPPGLLKSRLLGWPEKLRLLAEPLVRQRGYEEDESFARFIDRRFGRGLRPVADAISTGIFAGDPERLSVSAAFPLLSELERSFGSVLLGFIRRAREKRERPQLVSFEGGLSTLIEALSARLGPTLLLGHRVSAISQGPASSGWRLEGSEVERLVLTVPAFQAAALLEGVDPKLAEDLSQIPYAPVAVVHLGFDGDALPEPFRGFGYLCAEGKADKPLGVIFASCAFPDRCPGRTLLTFLFGGARNPSVVSWADDRLVRLAEDAARRTLRVKTNPLVARVQRWPAGIPQYEVGHRARLARIRQRVAGLPGLSLLGNAYDGVGLADCIRAAFSMAEAIAGEASKPPPRQGASRPN